MAILTSSPVRNADNLIPTPTTPYDSPIKTESVVTRWDPLVDPLADVAKVLDFDDSDSSLPDLPEQPNQPTNPFVKLDV